MTGVGYSKNKINENRQIGIVGKIRFLRVFFSVVCVGTDRKKPIGNPGFY
jgi:hypothetical protein